MNTRHALTGPTTNPIITNLAVVAMLLTALLNTYIGYVLELNGIRLILGKDDYEIILGTGITIAVLVAYVIAVSKILLVFIVEYNRKHNKKSGMSKAVRLFMIAFSFVLSLLLLSHSIISPNLDGAIEGNTVTIQNVYNDDLAELEKDRDKRIEVINNKSKAEKEAAQRAYNTANANLRRNKASRDARAQVYNSYLQSLSNIESRSSQEIQNIQNWFSTERKNLQSKRDQAKNANSRHNLIGREGVNPAVLAFTALLRQVFGNDIFRDEIPPALAVPRDEKSARQAPPSEDNSVAKMAMFLIICLTIVCEILPMVLCANAFSIMLGNREET